MAARRERLRGYRLAGVLLCLSAISPAPVFAATLSDADFATLAARCAPGVPEWVLRGVARTESNFYPWVLHDNSTHASANPAALANAEAQSLKMNCGASRKWRSRGSGFLSTAR